MIHRGERNREQKLKLILDFEKSRKKEEIRQAKRTITLYVCNECGLQIFFENKKKSTYISYVYNDFLDWFKNDPDFKPYEKKYNKKYGSWSNWCKYICLDCGYYVENIETGCEKCKSMKFVTANKLAGKPCPVCGLNFNPGTQFKGFKAYSEKSEALENEWYEIYRERYNVKNYKKPTYTEEEMRENNRRESIIKSFYWDDLFIVNNQNNGMRFEFKDAWLRGFSCILEWDNEKNKLTLFNNFDRNTWIEKDIEDKELKQIIELLMKYDYFNKEYFKDYFGFDGWTFGLEVKIENEYKELCLWGIKNGILYEIGMLLLKIAGKNFKDFYEYAW